MSRPREMVPMNLQRKGNGYILAAGILSDVSELGVEMVQGGGGIGRRWRSEAPATYLAPKVKYFILFGSAAGIRSSVEAATSRTSLSVASAQQIRGPTFEICVSKYSWIITSRLVLRIKLVINLGLKCGGLELSRSHASLAHITGRKPSLFVKAALMYCR